MAEATIREIEETWIITATFPANLSANNVVPAGITLEPGSAALNIVQVPAVEAWVIEDLYITGAPSVDAILEFKRNATQIAFKTSPISTLLVSNPSRPEITPFIYEGTDQLSISARNLANVDASAATITVYAKVRRFTPY